MTNAQPIIQIEQHPLIIPESYQGLEIDAQDLDEFGYTRFIKEENSSQYSSIRGVKGVGYIETIHEQPLQPVGDLVTIPSPIKRFFLERKDGTYFELLHGEDESEIIHTDNLILQLEGVISEVIDNQ
jgi:hypothetical protein